MSLIEVKVPDIGDFSGVDVIEVNIKPGDVIEKEQTLLTLESDKASMEVPSDIAGTVKEIKVKAGDKVSQGTVIALVEASTGAAAPAPAKAPEAPKPAAAAPAPAAAAPAPAPQVGSYGGSADIECDMLV
ncbi:TPA: biotin/lipoyl-binding protein, partial [Burkholderia vietnamiensis]|nr:biotin/lipoyl-binding protein [Burkholderia vietnamiensis]